MSAPVSTERRLWTGALLNALIILLMAPYGRALQHLAEGAAGKKIAYIFTVAIAGFGVHLLIRYVFGAPGGRLKRLLPFAAVAGVYAWRLMTLDVHVERFHLIEYGILSGLTCMALQQRRRDWSSLVWGLAAAWLIGLLDELFQWWWPTRVGEWRDVIINIQSGALGLAATALLFRNRLSFGKPSRRSFIAISAGLALLVMMSGLFILKVHVFGYRHTVPGIGSFYSVFPIDVLEKATGDAYLQAVERAGGHQSPNAITDFMLYFYEREGKEHFDRVHLLLEQNRVREARTEYLLTTRYYSPWLAGTGRAFAPEVLHRLDSATAADPSEFTSPVMNWLMTGVQRRDVIGLTWIIAGLLSIAAVFTRFRWL